MHWCFQENEAIFLLLSSIPLIKHYVKKWHKNWHSKHNTECSNKDHTNHDVDPSIRFIEVDARKDIIDILNNPPKFNPPVIKDLQPSKSKARTWQEVLANPPKLKTVPIKDKQK